MLSVTSTLLLTAAFAATNSTNPGLLAANAVDPDSIPQELSLSASQVVPSKFKLYF
jgi:hypothetical protein